MAWQVAFHAAFKPEFDALAEEAQNELLGMVELLKAFGPHLKRPGAATLSGSKHANMKELRFEADNGVWRVAYAFDPQRKAILLVAGDKAGVSGRRFYKALIGRADARFDQHLSRLKAHDGR